MKITKRQFLLILMYFHIFCHDFKPNLQASTDLHDTHDHDTHGHDRHGHCF